MKATLESAVAIPDAWFRMQCARLGRHALDLLFTVHSGRRGRIELRLAVLCRGVREHHIGALDGGGIRLYSSSHPAARQYNDPQGVISLPQGVEPSTLLGTLMLAHRDAVDDWIPFDRYVGEGAVVARRLASGKAVRVKGPLFLLRAYERALRRLGVDCSVMLARKTPIRPKTRVLHFSESFVVAEAFKIETP